MNKLTAVALALSLTSTAATANDFVADYGSIKIGFASWDAGVEDVGRGTLWKLMADYGAIHKGFEYYAFSEYNRFDHEVDGHNQVFAANTHIRLSEGSNWTAFGKFYAQFDNSYADDVSTVLGFGNIGIAGKQGFFKPFAGVHILSGDYKTAAGESVNGINGAMLGWTAAYHLSPHFTLGNWNEFEIARNDAYAEQQGGDFAINGGLTLSYKPVQKVSLDLTYRYFYNKLGWEGYGDQLIVMAGYKF